MIRVIWGEHKSRANWRKHRVSFSEAAKIFFDPLADTVNDLRHAAEELRFFPVGQTYGGR